VVVEGSGQPVAARFWYTPYMDISAQIMELERQVKATEYATKKHEDELKRLHGEVAK
jgi:hypothetical protein